MISRRAVFILAFVALTVARTAGATGILVPEDKELPPLAVKSHRVEADVEGGVASTRVEEVFRNNTDRRLEATFVFPVPGDAALTDFAMSINGKRQSAEVVEAGKAREIYQDIVRRLRDPGLLEYMDSGLLRMRVFPIEPQSDVKVEVSYSHALPFDAGVYEYTFPMKTGQKSSRVMEDFTLTTRITSRQPIKSVYSPTHEIGVTRKDDHHAIAGFEQMGATLDRDFTLFYTVGEKDFGLNLLTHRAEGRDGYFALMLAPQVEIPQEQVMAKDVCFVIDVSGSMQQEDRIASARDAVEFCLKALNPGDRFAIISFSSGVEVYDDGLNEASPANVRAAVEFVQGLDARGGTDLCGATVKALEMAEGEERPYLAVLVTDGEPTVGVTEDDEILNKVEEANKQGVRVFPFGIAENLDVPLLDRIAESTRGYSEYVAPGREIETRISSFFRKVSNPVLADLELDFGDVKVSDIYPPELPDLFRGSQVVVFGRYSGTGATAVRLQGTMRGARREFIYDASFPGTSADNGFVPGLWARRKIGFLLDQVRLHGEEKELVEEVTRLSKEYGIATPYTSYLVLEDEEAYDRHGILRRSAARKLRSAGVASDLAAPPGPRQQTAEWADYEKAAAGETVETANAITLSRRMREWKEADTASEGGPATMQRVGERTFVMLGDTWVDSAFTEEMETLTIKWGSDAYFNVLDALPHLREALVLSDSILIVIEGKALIVSEDGREDMTAEEIRDFFHK